MKVLSGRARKFKLELFNKLIGAEQTQEGDETCQSVSLAEKGRKLYCQTRGKTIYISQREREKLESHQNTQFIPATRGLEKFFTRGLFFKKKFTGGFVPPSQGRIWNCKERFFSPNPFIHPSIIISTSIYTVHGLIISLMFKTQSGDTCHTDVKLICILAGCWKHRNDTNNKAFSTLMGKNMFCRNIKPILTHVMTGAQYLYKLIELLSSL